MTIKSTFFGDPNNPPYLTDLVPYDGQPDAAEDNAFSFAIGAVQDTVDVTTLVVSLIQDLLGTPVTVPVIIAGVFQAGFSGSITPNLIGGYDVDIVHPDWSAGLYRAVVHAADFTNDSVDGTWDFAILPFPVASVTTVYGSVLRCTYPWPQAAEVPVQHRNKVWDAEASAWVVWITDYPDLGGRAYPGPGIFGVDTSVFAVETRVYGRYEKV